MRYDYDRPVTWRALPEYARIPNFRINIVSDIAEVIQHQK
jgi:hypothetical protein